MGSGRVQVASPAHPFTPAPFTLASKNADHLNVSLPWLTILSIVIAGWCFLSILGNERQRKLDENKIAKPPQPPQRPVGR